ncbi:EAL domain-containing protein [Ferrimonas lipolytica]|uniref:EAL domain-containing protein n=1 Tax=Ferrimonas lipolytica TaxID=2724191 RepID=A0A6H1UIH1_9GAMM|nr:EAL domain-containing protein [Ferrimonas lipolytica]QIZ78113.1 EAL domain-containing protein [Ferrimonas lipolytica]
MFKYAPSHLQIDRHLSGFDATITQRFSWLRRCITAVTFPLFLLCCSFTVTAIDYRFDTLQVENGLLSNYTNVIFQQSNGYVWLASDQGASRYDGHRFEHYRHNPGHIHHLSNNIITGFAEDSSGNVWVSTEFGLNKISPDGRVKHYLPAPTNSNAIASSFIMSIFADDSQRIWISGENGIQYYHPSSDSFVTIKAFDKHGHIINSGEFNQFVQLDNGELFIASDSGLLQANNSRSEFNSIVTDDHSSEILQSPISYIQSLSGNRLIVASTPFGIHLFDQNNGHASALFNNSSDVVIEGRELHAVLEISNGDVWLGYSNGIAVLDSQLQFVSTIKSDELNRYSLPGNTVFHLLQDRSGLIWVANTNGVSTYSYLRASTTLYQRGTTANSLSSNDVNAISSSGNQQLWIATDNAIAYLSSKHTPLEQFSFADNPPSRHIWQVRQSVDNRLWYAASDGIGFIDKNQGISRHFSNRSSGSSVLPNVDIFTVLPDEHGGVWFTGQHQTGLQYFHPDDGMGARYLDAAHPYSAMDHFTYNTIWGAQGEIWMATTNGVYRVDPNTGESQHYPLSNQSESARATDITLHPSGDIWVSSQGAGLVQLQHQHGEEHYRVNHIQPLPNAELPSFKAIAADTNNANLLWLISPYHLYRYDIQQQRFNSFPSLIESRNLSFVDTGLAHNGDNLYIASNIGLIEIDTEQLQPNTFEPPVLITHVKANGRKVVANAASTKERIALPYQDNTLEFSFAALDFTAPKRNQLRYRLVGADDDWIEAQGETSVTYTNLGSGDYHFMVEGSNSDGRWSSHIGHWYFNIAPPWWAYTLAGLCLVITLLGYVFAKHRIARIDMLRSMAFTDSLTGLANRAKFIAWLDKKCANSNTPFSVLYIDLDNFKYINDSFGHNVGDLYIHTIATKIKRTVRPTDRLARLGGDEFAIIVDGQLNKQDSDGLIARLLNRIAIKHQLNGQNIQGSASIGIACYPGDGADSMTLLKNADTAMYAAKRRGKNIYNFFSDSQSQQMHHEFNLSSEIHLAISKQQIHVYYQAKICVVTGKISGAEALARWLHPLRGMISPVDFIPVAESNGTIVPMGQQVLYNACKSAKEWHDSGLLTGPMSVNVSALELRSERFVESVLNTLEKTKLPAAMLELELTESLLVENIHVASDIINRLRQHGIRVSLDDFGTGYSSLSYLEKLPLDTLKIDRSFIRKMSTDGNENKVLRGVLRLAKELGLDVVAEGVETEQQLQQLHQYQCQQAQGFLICKPIDRDAFNQFLQARADYPNGSKKTSPNAAIAVVS